MSEGKPDRREFLRQIAGKALTAASALHFDHYPLHPPDREPFKNSKDLTPEAKEAARRGFRVLYDLSGYLAIYVSQDYYSHTDADPFFNNPVNRIALERETMKDQPGGGFVSGPLSRDPNSPNAHLIYNIYYHNDHRFQNYATGVTFESNVLQQPPEMNLLDEFVIEEEGGTRHLDPDRLQDAIGLLVNPAFREHNPLNFREPMLEGEEGKSVVGELRSGKSGRLLFEVSLNEGGQAFWHVYQGPPK